MVEYKDMKFLMLLRSFSVLFCCHWKLSFPNLQFVYFEKVFTFQTFNQKAYYFKSIVWIWERKLLAFKI